MTERSDPKATLLHYLQTTRDDLVWKLEGLDEREARLPRTVTGNNLLGLLKHCLNVEAGYFGLTFGRQFPSPGELVPEHVYDEDPQADWYARADETKDGLIDLYRRVAEFADRTIAELPLDAPGRVPWWRPGHQDVTLHQIIVHVTCDLARHAGHADILREQHDATVGWRRESPQVIDHQQRLAYVAKLTALADRFA
ncbi:DinB family protein [Micromonospora sp. WMMD723]|uniref:DinB family protein n=1 Tax=unclassified Micromonospora TaxID=2617518 RepID=UPI003B933121